MTPIQRTLLAIFAFMAVAIGSFIWFIANWDKATTKPIGAVTVPPIQSASVLSVSKKFRESAGWPPVIPMSGASAPILTSPYAGPMS
jgi:hypothetical protein